MNLTDIASRPSWVVQLDDWIERIENPQSEADFKINSLSIGAIIIGFKTAIDKREAEYTVEQIAVKIKKISEEKIKYLNEHPLSELISKIKNFFRFGIFQNSGVLGEQWSTEILRATKKPEESQNPHTHVLVQILPKPLASTQPTAPVSHTRIPLSQPLNPISESQPLTSVSQPQLLPTISRPQSPRTSSDQLTTISQPKSPKKRTLSDQLKPVLDQKVPESSLCSESPAEVPKPNQTSILQQSPNKPLTSNKSPMHQRSNSYTRTQESHPFSKLETIVEEREEDLSRTEDQATPLNNISKSPLDNMQETLRSVWKNGNEEERNEINEIWSIILKKAKLVDWKEIEKEPGEERASNVIGRYSLELEKEVNGKHNKAPGTAILTKQMIFELSEEGPQKKLTFIKGGLIQRLGSGSFSLDTHLKYITMESGKTESICIKAGILPEVKLTPQEAKAFWSVVEWED